MGQSVAVELAQVRGMAVMSDWVIEFQRHQKFAGAICWRLAMHLTLDRSRNNELVPPSLQQDLFDRLAVRHEQRPSRVMKACFPFMGEDEFKDYWYGKKIMLLEQWEDHVRRLGDVHLDWETRDRYNEAIEFLNLAHRALVTCRSTLTKRKWNRLLATRGAMLFTWSDSLKPPVPQQLTQKQVPPWRSEDDILVRDPSPDFHIPQGVHTTLKWWPDRGAMKWHLAITEYPMPFDREQPTGRPRHAVRLILDPFHDVWGKMLQEPRYQHLGEEWVLDEAEERERLQTFFPNFRKP